MYNKIAAYAWDTLIEKGDHIICAVSGGADSMALLWSMYLLKDKWDIRLSAAHFNHNLRGEESDADEAFVRQFCDHYDIPLYVGHGYVTAGEKGLEAAAREARYAFFATLDGKIATAHTADDNAETVLMHMIRGTGLKGLGGISPIYGGNVIRPMLSVTRAEVEAFLAEWSIRYITDSSNETDDFLRNRLRHHVMPLLLEENPRLVENFAEMIDDLRGDEMSLTMLSKLEQDLSVSELALMPPALRRRWLKDFLERNGVREPERSHILLTESLVFSRNPSARANLPGNVTIERCYDALRKAEQTTVPEPALLNCPGITELPQWGLRVICRPASQIINHDHIFTVAPGQNVVLRSRLPGDELRLPGGTKSLKKLYIDKKIPAAQREKIPVLADEQGVLGVYGLGVNLNRVPPEGNAMQFLIEK